MSILSWIRKATLLATTPMVRKFEKGLNDPELIQARTLQAVLKHSAHPSMTYEEFSKKIPIRTFEDFGSQIQCRDRVLHFESTSGSSGAVKKIPYTRPLMNSFRTMFALWLHDLLKNGPVLDTGRTWISITPPTSNAESFKDDSEYLSPAFRFLLSKYWVFPRNLDQNLRVFKRKLAEQLAQERNLEIISVWSPTFLEAILKEIFEIYPELTPQTLFPQLKIISCWTSASSAPAAERIQALFPNVWIQGKGLLATEAPMTIPWIPAKGWIPLLSEVFFEFLDENQNVFKLTQVKVGETYSLIISQKAGLLRYRIGDQVKVTHLYHQTPCLEFIGRGDDISDLVGEKLNEVFVRSCFDQVPGLRATPSLLLAAMDPKPHYVLLTSLKSETVASEMERQLLKAHHYRIARELGQLDPLKVITHPDPQKIYSDYFLKKGIQWGDLKTKGLIRNLEDAQNLLNEATHPHIE